jgi:hypothetical protein
MNQFELVHQLFSLCTAHLTSNFVLKGTLATIYRQRGRLRDCENILDIELEVLIRYQRSCEGTSQQQVCFHISLAIAMCSCLLTIFFLFLPFLAKR